MAEAPAKERWSRRGRAFKAVATSAGIAATFFSWFGIRPGTVAHWLAAVSAAVLVLVLGGVFILGTDESRISERWFGFLLVSAVLATCVLAAGAGWLSYAGLARFDHQGHAKETATVTTTTPTVAPRAEIEGTIEVADERTDDQYHSSIVAHVGERLAVQVWYYNREDVDSGVLARSVLVQIAAPIGTGSVTIDATIAGTNTNEVVAHAAVVLPPGTRLRFRPGSATWRHNPSQSDRLAHYVTTVVPDRVVDTGAILGDAGPCINCEATVRVEYDVVKE